MRAPPPALLLALLLPPLAAPAAADLPDVRHLTGEPDFREVTLRWDYARPAPGLAGFHVRYCELQAWGPHRCRTKAVPDEAAPAAVAAAPAPAEGSGRLRSYSVTISGLRMATNYSFEVRPVEARRARAHPPHAQLLAAGAAGRSIVVPTKGFSARATQCLPHASEVEVLTGPNFGGRIAVEAADGERCAVDGDPGSARDTYTLRIDHAECGSRLNASTVATFVLVQESLPILTHSTRRFLVLCTYQPETLTVRAGINLPSQSGDEDAAGENRVEQPLSEALPYAESINDVPVSRLQHSRQLVEARRAGDNLQDQSVAQLVLMIILVVAGVVGCAAAAWWFVPGLKRSVRGPGAPDSTSSASVYENFENSLRDTISIAGTETSSTDTDSLDIRSHECSCRAHNEDSTPGIFTIRIPPPLTRQQKALSCITIEATSQSEA